MFHQYGCIFKFINKIQHKVCMRYGKEATYILQNYFRYKSSSKIKKNNGHA